jgi:predicted nucleic acid-binding protein
LPHDLAARLIRTWTRFAVQDITLAMFDSALQIKSAHGFSYWDSAIIAAACALGCPTLYSEDMRHGAKVEGVSIVNPFL